MATPTPSSDFTGILQQYLSRNRGPDGKRPDYGVQATIRDREIDATLTFQGGRRYCCMEGGCHIDLLNGKPWIRLHEIMAVAGTDVPGPLILRLRVVVELGAEFYNFSMPAAVKRGVFAPANAHSYEVENREQKPVI